MTGVSRRISSFLLLIAVCSIAVRAGQNSIAVTFAASPARNTQIGAFVRQGTVYGSLNDLASVLNLTTGNNAALKQFSVQTAKFTVTVGANNPFVSVTDRDTNTSIRQLPYRVLFGANSYFVPIVSFLTNINSAFGEDITIDEAGTVITIGKPATVSRFDLTGLTVEQKENGIAVRLASQKPLRNFESWVKQEDDRTSLYITIDNARADSAALCAVKPNPIIDEVLIFPYPASVQIVLKLKIKSISVEPVPIQGSNDVIFAVRIPMPEPMTPPPSSDVSKEKQVTSADSASDDPDTDDAATKVKSSNSKVGITDPEVPAMPVVDSSKTAEQQESQEDVKADPAPAPTKKSEPPARPGQNSKQPKEPAKQGKNVSESLDRQRSRWKLDCIVLDAGHGGFDPGTIGVTRTKEKDVTLAVALKLGKLIERGLRDVRVVYTRKTDEFIELYKRGQIANAAGGKLFISIHCNAAAHKPSPANGFEIYLLRPGKTENALRIASRENEVVKLEKDYENRYQTLDENRFILLTMAQSAYVKYSERFAEITSDQMKNGTSLEPNGVKQAGFYVLVGASMPNVLVETAYLSNRSDEKFLKSGSGQQQIAEAIYSAIKVYKKEYEMALGEGKDIGGE